MKLFDTIKGAFQKMGANMGISREYKDVFDIPGVPAYRQFYQYGVFVWKYLYRGKYNAWHLISAPTVANSAAKREMFRTDMPKALCAELAGMVWSEACKVNVSADGFLPDGDNPDDTLGRFIKSVLFRDNNFSVKMQEAIEQAMALGGEALKVWYEEKYDANGAVIPGTGKIKIGYCMADQFVPLTWDNADVEEGLFVSRKAKDGYYYTRLEWHKWDGQTYVVSNELYRSDMHKNGSRETQDILGYRYPLEAVYPHLRDETPMVGLNQSLFSYFRTPIANNIDDNSPLGVSIYANAMSTLHALDICYDSFVREFRLGKKRIIVPARCVRTVQDPETGTMRRYFDPNDETYEAMSTDAENELMPKDASCELRVEEHVSAINAFLSILCLQVGFSSSTFTFDAKGGIKTATEVVSENSKTYKTVKNCQSVIGPAIEKLVHNIIAVASIYDVSFEGTSVSALAAGGYTCSIYWDDAIIQDRQTDIAEGVNLVLNGLMSKKKMMVEKLGYTEKQADSEIAQIASEQHITLDNLLPSAAV